MAATMAFLQSVLRMVPFAWMGRWRVARATASALMGNPQGEKNRPRIVQRAFVAVTPLAISARGGFRARPHCLQHVKASNLTVATLVCQSPPIRDPFAWMASWPRATSIAKRQATVQMASVRRREMSQYDLHGL